MSTNARIGIKLEDGSILSAYHHWDGYPEWLGVTLKTQYNKKEKVAELIDGGNMSSCYSDNVYDYESKSLSNVTHNQSIMVGKMKDPDSVRTSLSLHLIQKMEKSSYIFSQKMSGMDFLSITNMMMITTSWILKLFQLTFQMGMSQMTVN